MIYLEGIALVAYLYWWITCAPFKGIFVTIGLFTLLEIWRLS